MPISTVPWQEIWKNKVKCLDSALIAYMKSISEEIKRIGTGTKLGK
jgi:hypothetical protein